MVVEARHGPDGTRDLELLIGGVIDEVRAVDRAMADVALDAWRRFGKGRHPAALNFGGWFAYAVAAVDAVPLLFVGRDFGQTDVAVATY